MIHNEQKKTIILQNKGTRPLPHDFDQQGIKISLRDIKIFHYYFYGGPAYFITRCLTQGFDRVKINEIYMKHNSIGLQWYLEKQETYKCQGVVSN